MIRQRIIGRLRYLRNLEIWNIISIPASLVIVMTQLAVPEWRMMVYGTIVITLIFVQGAIYWELKHHSISHGSILLPAHARTHFGTVQWINVVLLAAYPILTLYGLITGATVFMTGWWSHSVFGAAVIMYINYYHWQISHDNPTDMRYLVTHQILRRSALYTDLHQMNVSLATSLHQSPSSPHTDDTTQGVHLTAKSQPLPSLSSAQSQPLPTAKSQPLPSLSSAQSQPLPTAKSQPLPSLSSAQSQPLPTVPSAAPGLAEGSITQPLPYVDDAQLMTVILDEARSSITEPIINDQILAEYYQAQQAASTDTTNTTGHVHTSAGTPITRTPIKNLRTPERDTQSHAGSNTKQSKPSKE